MQRDIEMAALTALGLSVARTIDVDVRPPIYCEPPTDGPLVAVPDGSDVARQTYTAMTRNGRATYAAQIPADAKVFDTHVATLVESLERSGADRAVSDGIRPTAESPGYALVPGAFSLSRVQGRGEAVVRVPRVTGVLSS
jgi:hypothetical protein